MLSEKGADLVEPTPVIQRSVPRVIPDRVVEGEKDATIYVADVYQGNGMSGVPRGTVDSLLVFEFHYNYMNTGGHFEVGYEGPWDVRVIHGRVPVAEDGSALFTAPANTPLAVQPLDAEGKSLQMHRSWFTAMPGEFLSCVGCHENPREAPMMDLSAYTEPNREPSRIEPWYGPARGFSFRREVQPVLDRYCIGCHDGGSEIADLRDTGLLEKGDDFNSYSQSYVHLSRFVRRNGPEGDYHVLTPGEFHPDTSELVRLLEKGHHGVRLDEEAWDRLITWIDLNVPFHGTWTEANNANRHRVKQRLEHNRKYANLEVNYEEISGPEVVHAEFQPPSGEPPEMKTPRLEGWPFDSRKAKELQGEYEARVLELGNDQSITLARVPAGEFVMGDARGFADEKPEVRQITQPFWMAVTEITQGQFRQFDPDHTNGYYDMQNKDQVDRGYPLEGDHLPVIRVSWQEATAFCEWLSKRTGLTVTLPTEAQWEWACRAGSAEPLWWGGLDADFGDFANLADASIGQLAVTRHQRVMRDPHWIEDFLPRAGSVDDGVLHLAEVGSYTPNPWGLHDMHGNVAEWTRDRYLTRLPGGRKVEVSSEENPEYVTRGGSWRSRPKWARAGLRMEYPGWQRVFDVGFRVIVEEKDR
jgi:formylglycine-generating enzyme required for sulfatase activity